MPSTTPTMTVTVKPTTLRSLRLLFHQVHPSLFTRPQFLKLHLHLHPRRRPRALLLNSGKLLLPLPHLSRQLLPRRLLPPVWLLRRLAPPRPTMAVTVATAMTMATAATVASTPEACTYSLVCSFGFIGITHYVFVVPLISTKVALPVHAERYIRILTSSAPWVSVPQWPTPMKTHRRQRFGSLW